MTTEEQQALIDSTLRDACQRVGINVEQIKDQIAIKVLADGDGVEVVPVNPETNCRQLSAYADRTWATIDEAVSRFVQAHAESRTAAKPGREIIAGATITRDAEGRIVSVDGQPLQSIRRGSVMMNAGRNSGSGKRPRPPAKVPPQVAGQTDIVKLSPRQMMELGRKK